MSNKRFVYSTEGKGFWHRNHAKKKKLDRIFDIIDAERGGQPFKVDTQGITKLESSLK